MRSIAVFTCLLVSLLACCALAGALRTVVEPAAHQPYDWVRGDLAPPDSVVTLHVAVKQQRVDELEDLFWAVSNPHQATYGQYVALPKLNMLTAPSSDSVRAVKDWVATELHALSVECLAECSWIVVRTTVARANHALATQFYEWSRPSMPTLLRATGYSVPDAVADHVDFVGGVKRLPRVRSLRVQRLSADAMNAAVTPDVARQAFNVTARGSTTNGNIQAVAQFLGQYYSPSDLAQFQSQFNVPSQKVAKVVGPNDETDPGVEASLDIEYIIGVNQGTPTYFYVTPGLHDKQEPFLQWITSLLNGTDPNAPNVHSVSYGDVESSLDVAYIGRVNMEFQKIGASGKTLVFASGDDGVGCNGACTKFEPNYPGSSPYVLAVGGIASPTVGDSISSGGFSNVHARLSYQDKVVQAYLAKPDLPSASFYNATGRAIPDVASFSENVLIVWNEEGTGVGGTSCAAPVVGGILSLLNDVRMSQSKPKLGFVGPLLYSLHASHPEAFNDITQGRNSNACCTGFPATEGYDCITGLGTLNFGRLADLMEDDVAVGFVPGSCHGEVLRRTFDAVKALLSAPGVDRGHNHEHARTVARHVYHALQAEPEPVAPWHAVACRLAALLHDVDDRKVLPSLEDAQHRKGGNARRLLRHVLHSVPRDADDAPPEELAAWVHHMVSLVGTVTEAHAATEPGGGATWPSERVCALPGQCDKLEALGLVGVARCYAFSKHRGRSMWLPTTQRATTVEQLNRVATPERFAHYKATGASVSMMDHVYDKLLHLKVGSECDNAYVVQQMAQRREAIVQLALQFGREGSLDEAYMCSLCDQYL